MLRLFVHTMPDLNLQREIPCLPGDVDQCSEKDKVQMRETLLKHKIKLSRVVSDHRWFCVYTSKTCGKLTVLKGTHKG